MKKIAVVTSGGDAPGMNAALRAVVREAIFYNMEVMGIQHGYCGLLENTLSRLNLRSVSGIINRGGTFLKTARCAEIKTAAGIKRAAEILREHGIEGLIVIGGDGSIRGGERISKYGIAVVGIPASIDNDVYGTEETIGFDTALNTATEAIDKIRDTAVSHERVFIVEVMGREHGFLTLAVGLASGSEFILIPEVKFRASKLCADIKDLNDRGKTSIIISFAEGAGNPYELAKTIERLRGIEVRVSSLGYIQRGGAPSARSRILASQFGAYAVELLRTGKRNQIVVTNGRVISSIPIAATIGNEKKIDMEVLKLAGRLAL